MTALAEVEDSFAMADTVGDESDVRAITCYGDATWAPIEAFLEKHGPSAMMAKFREAPADTVYTAWLAKVLEHTSDAGGDMPWIAMPDGAEEKLGTLSLMACPLDTSRARALRSIQS